MKPRKSPGRREWDSMNRDMFYREVDIRLLPLLGGNCLVLILWFASFMEWI